MKNVLKGIATVAGIIGAVKLIEQGNHNSREIARLHNRNNELHNELRKVKNEGSDLQHQIKMMNITVDHHDKMIDMDRKDSRELGRRVFELEMDNIGLKSAARRNGSTTLDFYTDRMKEKKEETGNDQAFKEMQEDLDKLLA